MLDVVLVAAAILSAFQVMRARRLMLVSLWLACTSALVATMLYRLGAPEVAVIELSVGAGLVTVLFVFAFSIVGERTSDVPTLVPRPLVWGIILVVVLLLGRFIFPLVSNQNPTIEGTFADMLWGQRSLDVLAQIVLIFSGVIGLLGLLSERKDGTSSKESRPTGELATGDARLPVSTGIPDALPEEPLEEVLQ